MVSTPYALTAKDMSLIKEALDRDLLSREEETLLARRWRDDQDQKALNQMILAYSKIVVAAARGFSRYGFEFSDLAQEGHVGLMQAAHNFDPERGTRFGTFAAFHVRSAIQDYIMRNWSTLKTTNSSVTKTLFFHLSRLKREATAALQAEGVADPTEREVLVRVATTLSAPLDTVLAFARQMQMPLTSLNLQVGEEEDSEIGDFVTDESMPTPEESAISAIDGNKVKAMLAHALDMLPPRDREIIRRRYLKDEPDTLKDISDDLNISRERVRQLEMRSLRRLRKHMPTDVTP
jgi:RNA polymerase sigma-32 factor